MVLPYCLSCMKKANPLSTGRAPQARHSSMYRFVAFTEILRESRWHPALRVLKAIPAFCPRTWMTNSCAILNRQGRTHPGRICGNSPMGCWGCLNNWKRAKCGSSAFLGRDFPSPRRGWATRIGKAKVPRVYPAPKRTIVCVTTMSGFSGVDEEHP